MAATLLVRTTKNEYTSGDIVYGAVYLKISGPTSAYGVRIKFYGYETFSYSAKKHVNTDDDVLHDTKEYVASDQISLHEFPGPIALGQYVFPFHKRLPMDLPGSTRLKSADDDAALGAEWKVEIVYGVEASLIGAEAIKARQDVVVTQSSLKLLAGSEISDGFVETKTIGLSTWMPLVTIPTKVSVSLDRQEYYTGDNLKLKLEIEKNSIFQPKIESITFQLLRDLRITFDRSTNKGSRSSSQSFTWPLCSRSSIRGLPKTRDNFLTDNTLPCGYVHPEGPFVVRSCRIVDIEGTSLINGIQELLVPLKDNAAGHDVPATTIGQFISLMYSIKVIMKFQRNDLLTFHLPLCTILPRCQKWSSWKPGDWVHECLMVNASSSPCSVSQEVLESVEFSSLPSFQVI